MGVLTLSSGRCSAATEMDGRRLILPAMRRRWWRVTGRRRQRERPRLDSSGEDGEGEAAELVSFLDSLGSASIDGYVRRQWRARCGHGG